MMTRLKHGSINSGGTRDAVALVQVPKFSDRLRFVVSSRARILHRGVLNLFNTASNLARVDRELFPYSTAEVASEIFSENPAETTFIEGKRKNLEIACNAIDGLVLMPGETFSFWKLVGRPVRARGFVTGREIRAGCLIPTIGGGLCQLSGSLYQSAVDAGLEITERHRHSRRLPDTPYDPKRDATVFWNYVDLRFRTDRPVVIEARVDGGELKTGFRFQTPVAAKSRDPLVTIPDSSGQETDGVNDCLSCGKITCGNHLATQDAVLGRLWFSRADLVLARKLGLSYSSGPLLSFSHRIERILQGLLTRWGWPTGRVALARARFAAFLLRVTHWNGREVFVSQSTLPFLQAWLAKKQIPYSVFAPHLPMDELQRRLDTVAVVHPYDPLIRDYRVGDELLGRERRALESAKRLFVAHPFLKELFPRAQYVGPLTTSAPKARAIKALVFPGPLRAREGVHEVVAAARALGVEVVSYHPAVANSGRANILGIRYVPLDEIKTMPGTVVVHPAVFETPQSAVLELYRAGIPVVATRGVPLSSGSFVEIPLADAGAIVKALQSLNCAPH